MIAQIIKPKQTGRNEPCPCGKLDDASKPVKFKKCCMPKAEVNKVLNQSGLWAIFRQLIDEQESGELVIKYENLLKIPSDKAIISKFDIDKDEFTLKVVKVKKQTILTREKRIIG